MAGCDDTRQLTEQQRQDGYQQQRTGVQQAVRPFTGKPTAENLADYINRELFPAVKATRKAANDIYLQVADNAPSANPLAYYFSVETAAADPTAGRMRLDASPQDTATTLRISQTNGRLQDVAAWLDVMAGSSTEPLGVVTLFDAINPSRFLRFDLSTMVDQGSYWDLGVIITESSHDDPFVEAEGVVLSFIPGVASTGATVPTSGLSPIAANTVLGNATASTAPPTAIPLGTNTVLGRQGGNVVASQVATGQIADGAVTNAKIRDAVALSVIGRASNSTGNVADVVASGARKYLRTSEDGTAMAFANISQESLPQLGADQIYANLTSGFAAPTNVPLVDFAGDALDYNTTTNQFNVKPSTSIEILSDTVVRAALTGDVAASQNANATTIQPNVVSDGKLRQSAGVSVIGRSPNSTGNVADITATVNNRVLVRHSDALAFEQIVNLDIAAGTIALDRLSGINANTVVGNNTGSLANPVDIAIGTNTVLGRVGSNIVAAQLVNAQITDATIANAKLANMVEATVKGRAVAAGTGAPQDLTAAQVRAIVDSAPITELEETGAGPFNDYAPSGARHIMASNAAGVFTGVSATGFVVGDVIIFSHQGTGYTELQHNTGSSAGNVFFTGRQGRNLRIFDNEIAIFRYLDTVAGATTTTRWELASPLFPFAQSSADAAGDVIAHNGTNYVAVAGGNSSDVVLRGNATFGTVSNAALATIASPRLKGRTTTSTGAVEDLTLTDSTSITWNTASGGTISLQRAALTGDVTATANANATTIANDAVTDAKLRNSAALSVIGRSANSSGDPADIAAANDGEVLRRNGTALGFGTIATAGIADAAVTLAKLANLAAGTVIGRQVTAATGVPVALTGLEQGENLRVGGFSGNTVTTGTYNNVAVASNVKLLDIQPSGGDVTYTGFAVTGGNSGCFLVVAKFGTGGNVILAHNTGSSAGNVIFTPNGVNWVLETQLDMVLLWYFNGRWQVVGRLTPTSGIVANAVTNTIIRDSGALSVIGRSANSSGDPADISATATSGAVLRESGSALGFGTVAAAGLASDSVTTVKILDANVTLAKMADLAQSRIIGRAESAGTGVPTSLTPTQVVAIIDGENATWTGNHAFNGASFDVTASSQFNLASTFTSTINSGASLIITASTSVDINSPHQLNNATRLTSTDTSSTIALINVSISGNVLRLTGSNWLLSGMVPVYDGRFMVIVNAHATDNGFVLLESVLSTAANRFAGIGTSRVVRPGEMAVAWYDTVDDRWRLLCRDDADL